MVVEKEENALRVKNKKSLKIHKVKMTLLMIQSKVISVRTRNNRTFIFYRLKNTIQESP